MLTSDVACARLPLRSRRASAIIEGVLLAASSLSPYNGLGLPTAQPSCVELYASVGGWPGRELGRKVCVPCGCGMVAAQLARAGLLGSTLSRMASPRILYCLWHMSDDELSHSGARPASPIPAALREAATEM